MNFVTIRHYSRSSRKPHSADSTTVSAFRRKPLESPREDSKYGPVLELLVLVVEVAVGILHLLAREAGFEGSGEVKEGGGKRGRRERQKETRGERKEGRRRTRETEGHNTAGNRELPRRKCSIALTKAVAGAKRPYLSRRLNLETARQGRQLHHSVTLCGLLELLEEI